MQNFDSIYGPASKVKDLINAYKNGEIDDEIFFQAVVAIEDEIYTYEQEFSQIEIPQEFFAELQDQIMNISISLDFLKNTVELLKTYIQTNDISILDDAIESAQKAENKLIETFNLTKSYIQVLDEYEKELDEKDEFSSEDSKFFL